MRPVLAASTLLVLLLVVASAAAAQTIAVSPRQIDFGDMKQRETRSATVTVTNEGGGKLVIANVDADCGCTVPTMGVRELLPGESTTMEIEFNSKRFTGNVFKTVRIESNDPVNRVVDVIVMADVATPIVVDPVSRRVGFASSPRGEVHTQRVTFTATEAERLEIEAKKTRRGLFEIAVVHDLDGDPRKAALDVTLPADMPPGRQRDNVRVRTNVEDMPTIDIEMACTVHEALRVSPEKVNWRFKPELKSSIRVAPAIKGTKFKVTGAETDLPEITVEVRETAPNKETLVILDGAPIPADDARARAARGRIKGTLTIRTDLESQPEITIPLTYMVRM